MGLLLLLSAVVAGQTSGPVDLRRTRFLVVRIVAADKATGPWVGTALETGLAWYFRRHPRIDAVPIPWRDRAMRDAGYLPTAEDVKLADAKRSAELLGVRSFITGTCRTTPTQLEAELHIHDVHTEQAQHCIAAGRDVRELLADAAARLFALQAAAPGTPDVAAGELPAYSGAPRPSNTTPRPCEAIRPSNSVECPSTAPRRCKATGSSATP